MGKASKEAILVTLIIASIIVFALAIIFALIEWTDDSGRMEKATPEQASIARQVAAKCLREETSYRRLESCLSTCDRLDPSYDTTEAEMICRDETLRLYLTPNKEPSNG